MKKTIILIPIYNDWKSVFKLLEDIDKGLEGWGSDAAFISVIIINDGSKEEKQTYNSKFNNFRSIQIINMKKNKGHARCIAAGLKYIKEKEDFDFIIPMDGDGEDRPEEIGSLLCKAYENPDKVITANRVKRSEGFIFKFCYLAHKYLTLVFTGQNIKYGNYTCLPRSVVDEMVNEPAIWSSFSGSLAKIAKDRKSISSVRGKRYFGPSKMSFINLLKHSLAIMAVFKETLLIRSVIFILFYGLAISDTFSILISIPLLLTLSMIISVYLISTRENMTEFGNSLNNIKNITDIKSK